MFHLIDRMREKSKARRKVLALSIAGVISGIIFVVWLLAFIASSEQTSVQEGNNNNFSFGSFFESFQDEAENVKAQFNEFNISLESLKFDPMKIRKRFLMRKSSKPL